jgi:ring-1,2-phenylacetyl-CoA epoxidase subunit PaaD
VVTAASTAARVRAIAETVPDPELPQLTVADLGILRDVTVTGRHAVVTITPTYTGCPALQEIRSELRRRLEGAGFDDVEVRTSLSPAWTSDWITEEGRQKLGAAGIVPPRPAPLRSTGPVPLTLVGSTPTARCPHCTSPATTQQSVFGATACRALYFCTSCGEPFEYLKEI